MNPKRNLVLGMDFDNTLVSYDELMHQTAVRLDLIEPDVRKDKKAIRDQIRQRPHGEIEWQKLQAFIYGRGMEQAQLMDGVTQFFNACKVAKAEIYIISHKTNFASMDPSGINLRERAIDWMKKHRFFEKDGLGLLVQQVYFEPTRQEKITRIQKLGCTHFIDDLEETFLEDSFPRDVEKILFASHQPVVPLLTVRVFDSWRKIDEYFFTA